MKQITSFEEYRRIHGAVKAGHEKLETNCSMTSSGLRAIIEDGVVLYEEVEQGLILYVDERSYYRVIYFLDPGMPLPDMRKEKSVSIEELDSNGRRRAYLDGFFGRLESAGWKRTAHNLCVEGNLGEMAAWVEDEFPRRADLLSARGLTLAPCTSRHVDAAIALWHDYLHMTDIPSEHLAFMGDEEQHVTCVLNADDQVCGVNWWSINGARCEIRHTVTDPGYYNQGLAYTMVLEALHEAVKAGCRIAYTYIDEVNYRSLALFEKLGIVPNGRTTTQYLLEGDSK